jgi:hypothetical protein
VVASAWDAVDASGNFPARHLLPPELQREMVDPNRSRLEGLVEVDETEAPLPQGQA